MPILPRRHSSMVIAAAMTRMGAITRMTTCGAFSQQQVPIAVGGGMLGVVSMSNTSSRSNNSSPLLSPLPSLKQQQQQHRQQQQQLFVHPSSSAMSQSGSKAFLFERHGHRQQHGAASFRLFSSSSSSNSSNNDDNNDQEATGTTDLLPNLTGDRNGLLRHEIIADDGHPLRIYSRTPRSSSSNSNNNSSSLLRPSTRQRTILLIHGRTWSSQPVFDLRTSPDDDKQQSTLQSLTDLGFAVYALDLRGFGETPRDTPNEDGVGEGYTTPRRCVEDVKCAIDWIAQRHGRDDAADGTTDGNNNDATPNNYGDANNNNEDDAVQDPTIINTKPALLGWSQGALVAQMYAQKYGPATLSDLVLYASIYDPRVIYPRRPLYDPSGRFIGGNNNNKAVAKPPAPLVPNTDIAALEDFTLPGSICDEAALTFSNLALATDPYKAPWDELHEFNTINPALVHIPTCVIVGQQDPYVTWEAQRELFERLGTEDKVWCVMPGCDHAAHILKARKMFVRSVVGFLLRKDGF